jgi:Thrombospondin type 3 repeat
VFEAHGLPDVNDNCDDHANANQSNIDRDGKGDVCDSDMDGDGHANSKEQTHGTNERDPNDYPRKGRTLS